MDKDNEKHADAFKNRMHNRNRRKRPHRDEEPSQQDSKDENDSRPPKRRSDASSDPDERNESGDSSSTGAILRMRSLPFMSLEEYPDRTGNQADTPTPQAATGLFRPSSMQAQSEPQVLPVISRGYLEAAGHLPSLSSQHHQQQQQIQQALQMQHAFQQQQQMQNAMALLTTGSLGPYASPFNNPSATASLRAGFPNSGFPNPMLPFATMNPSLLQTISSLSSISSDAGLSAAFARPSITSQRLLGGLQTPAAAEGPSPPLALPANMDRIEDLYMESDDDVLSNQQIVIRKQIEFFIAGQEDIDSFTPGRRKELSVGQVGIRCKHCAGLARKERPRGAVYFPSTLSALYQAAQNMSSIHFSGTCQQIDPMLKEQLIQLQETKAVSGHKGKKYWAEGAMARGIYETEIGLRFRDG